MELDRATRGDRGSRSRHDLFGRIGGLLADNFLEPTPSNYDLAYRYLAADDDELVGWVNAAIAEHGHLTQTAAASILARRSSEPSVSDLTHMADEAQVRLQQITDVVERSGRDVSDYREALERNVNDLVAEAPSGGAFEGLVGITLAMIEKTRSVGEELRRRGDEMMALRESLAEARRTADTDPLTGLPNRRALDVRLRAAFDAARQAKTPLSIAICDIDEFKAVNDLHGHQIGDEVIKFIAAALSKDDASKLFVARYGGEEFVMLFEGIVPEAAAAEINRIRADLAAREFKVTATGRQLGRLTFSAGIAGLTGRKGPSAILKNADTALYRAKQEGRNRVCIAE